MHTHSESKNKQVNVLWRCIVLLACWWLKFGWSMFSVVALFAVSYMPGTPWGHCSLHSWPMPCLLEWQGVNCAVPRRIWWMCKWNQALSAFLPAHFFERNISHRWVEKWRWCWVRVHLGVSQVAKCARKTWWNVHFLRRVIGGFTGSHVMMPWDPQRRRFENSWLVV